MANGVSHWLDVRDKPALVHRLMVELAGDAHISLEGNVSRCRFPDDLVVSRGETGLLKRATLAPVLDFVVLRLTAQSISPIFHQMMVAGLKRGIIHLQIERKGVLELGAYDHFHPGCVVTGPGIGSELLDELRSSSVLRNFSVAAADGG